MQYKKNNKFYSMKEISKVKAYLKKSLKSIRLERTILKNIHHIFKEFYITTNEKGYHIYLSDIEELEQNLKNLEIKNDDDKKFYNWLIKEKENKEFLYNIDINEIVNQINNYSGTYLNPRDIELVYLNDPEKQKERLAKIY